MEVSVRPLEFSFAATYSTITDLIKDEVYDDVDPVPFLRWMDGMPSISRGLSWWFVAEDGPKLLGVISWIVDDLYGDEAAVEISFIAVDESYQHRGIGRRLVEETLPVVSSKLQEEGLKFAFVFVETDESNEGARAFYRKVLKVVEEHVALPGLWENDTPVIFYARP